MGGGKCIYLFVLLFAHVTCPTSLYFLCFAKESNKERRLLSNRSAGQKVAIR